MAKWNKWVKIMAILALFGIVIWIIWTGLLIIFWNQQPYESEQTLTPEQYLELQELMKASSWTGVETSTWVSDIEIIMGTWSEEIIESWSWEIK